MGFSLSGFGDFISSAGSAIVQGLVNGYYNKKAASQSFDYTKSLIDYENEYNKPVNVRARLEEAGYNPNLALNGINVQSATGSAPQVKPTQIDLLAAYNLDAQYELLRAQRNLANQNTAVAESAKDKNDAEAEKIAEQTKGIEIKNEIEQAGLDFYKETGIPPGSVLHQYVAAPYKATKSVVDKFAGMFDPSIESRLGYSAWRYNRGLIGNKKRR